MVISGLVLVQVNNRYGSDFGDCDLTWNFMDSENSRLCSLSRFTAFWKFNSLRFCLFL